MDVAELRKELREAREERDILKRAVANFVANFIRDPVSRMRFVEAEKAERRNVAKACELLENTKARMRELREADPKPAGEIPSPEAIEAAVDLDLPEIMSAWPRCTTGPRRSCRNGSPGGAGPAGGRPATMGRRPYRGRVHTGPVGPVIRLPEPKIRPDVEARRKAGADILRPYRARDVWQEKVSWLREHRVREAKVFRVPLDPTIDILTAVGPTDPPAAVGR